MSERKERDEDQLLGDAEESSREDAAETAGFAEYVYNNKLIDWRYWAEQMPAWTSAQAARLMCALDPDVFDSYANRPNSNDQSALIEKAKRIERLADAQGITSLSPPDWVEWAAVNEFSLHSGVHLAIDALKMSLQIGQIFAKQEAKKLERGRHTLEEAATQIGAASGAPVGQVLRKLMDAALAGTLPMFAPGVTTRYVYGPGAGGPVRDFYEEAYWDDLNVWIEANEPRLEFGFPAPAKPTAAHAEVKQEPVGLTKDQIVTAFGELISTGLAKAMADGARWTVPAKLSSGTKGGRHASMWDPVVMASALQDKKNVAVSKLNQAFNSHNFLSPWREEWNRVSTL